MANGHPVYCRQVREALEGNDVFERIDEIQHATRMTAVCEVGRATVLVFKTGTILVQGRPSRLETWLREVRESILTGCSIPRFVKDESEMPQEIQSTRRDYEEPPFD